MGGPAKSTCGLDALLSEFLSAIDDGTAAVFAGAGLSRPAGFVDWKGLLRDLAHELDLDIDVEDDLVSVAQYHLNENNQSRDRLNQLLVTEFEKHAVPTASHQILARLPVRTFWTTNYDGLIETALKERKKRVDVKATASRLTTTVRGCHAAVYKMHGDTADPDRMVLTRDDYDKYAADHARYLDSLRADFWNKTFLFLGFSFTDPNLGLLLSQMRGQSTATTRTHYTVLRRESEADYKTRTAYDYAANKQRLRIDDLQRYGIRVWLVDEYSEIVELLSELERRFRRRHVLVSGACADPAPLGAVRVDALCRALGQGLMAGGYYLVSGMGLGIGNQVLLGALEKLYADEVESIERRLQLRPFPQGLTPDEKTKLFPKYRSDLVAGAGFVVVVCGNKQVGDQVVDSPGVLEEVRLAQDQGALVIPIGATGGAARTLWSDYQTRLDEVYGGRIDATDFAVLGNEAASEDALVIAVMGILSRMHSNTGAGNR